VKSTADISMDLSHFALIASLPRRFP